jgi:hypothetical protein
LLGNTRNPRHVFITAYKKVSVPMFCFA